jgi:lysophospholipase L1-like esterase
VAENGGVASDTAVDGIRRITGAGGWLALFPGRYVGISYGTNDAGNYTPDQFYANYETIVKAVIAAGKIPVIPTIIWSPSGTTAYPPLNAKLGQLKAAYPQIVSGPDLYAYFQGHTEWLEGDGVHPNATGYSQMRQAWASAMLSVVYR